MVKAIGAFGDTMPPCNRCQATMKDSTSGVLVDRGPFKKNWFCDSKIILVELAYIG